MGRSEGAPDSGGFVRRQMSAIQDISGDELVLSYFEMPAKSITANSALKRYSGFLYSFAKQYIFSKKTYSILHVHFFFPTIVLAIAYKVFRNPKVKIVTTFHGNDIYYYKKFTWWYRWCFSFVDHSIFVTQKLKEQFFKQKLPHTILCAGMLPIFSSSKPKDSVKKYDFIFVGTLDKNKGALRLKKLLAVIPDSYTVAIVGAGMYEEDFITLAKEKNIDYFNFCTAQQLVDLYHQTKWLVNLSYNESFGLVITEALACGLPVLATKSDGSLSQVFDGVNGFIVAQDERLISNIVTILTNTTETSYNQLSEKARQGSEKFTLPYVAKEIKDIYIEVVSK
jgi:glycosyltransferase involved in cell wall biosynthesis